MSTDINLLLPRDKASLRQRKILKIFNVAAVASLIIVGLLSLGIFLLIQAVNSSSVKVQEDDLLRRMSQFQNRQANLFILNNRIVSIDNILKIRSDIPKIMDSVLSKIPGNLVIENFEVDGRLVIVTGYSKSLSVIGEFINNLTDMVYKKEIVKSLTLNSLSLDTGRNIYPVSVTLGL